LVPGGNPAVDDDEVIRHLEHLGQDAAYRGRAGRQPGRTDDHSDQDREVERREDPQRSARIERPQVHPTVALLFDAHQRRDQVAEMKKNPVTPTPPLT
jgi:hypothetical protein